MVRTESRATVSRAHQIGMAVLMMVAGICGGAMSPVVFRNIYADTPAGHERRLQELENKVRNLDYAVTVRLDGMDATLQNIDANIAKLNAGQQADKAYMDQLRKTLNDVISELDEEEIKKKWQITGAGSQ